RAVGGQLPEAADHPADGGDPADLSRRRVLLDRHAAAVLAQGHAVQPGGVPDLRHPLELLRHLGCLVGGELRRDAGLPRAVPGVARAVRRWVSPPRHTLKKRPGARPPPARKAHRARGDRGVVVGGASRASITRTSLAASAWPGTAARTSRKWWSAS